MDILGLERGAFFCEAYWVTFGGDFEDKNILHHPEPLAAIAKRLGLSLEAIQRELQRDRQTLRSVRDKRVWPALDDKVLCSWNALMIGALARAGAVFSIPKYIAAAEAAAKFIQQSMTKDDGRLVHAWRNGTTEIDGFLEDYSYLAEALVALFEFTGNPIYIDQACGLVSVMVHRFHDEQGGFYFTASDSETLITRYKDQHDGSVPSGNSMAATALVRLARLTNDPHLIQLAQETIHQASYMMHHSPGSVCQMLLALEHYIGPSVDWIYVSKTPEGIQQAIGHAFATLRPRSIVLVSHEQSDGRNSLSGSKVSSLVEGRKLGENESVVLYQCIDGACTLPVCIQMTSNKNELQKE